MDHSVKNRKIVEPKWFGWHVRKDSIPVKKEEHTINTELKRR